MAEENISKDRRRFLKSLGKGALVVGVVGQAGAMMRSLVPDVLYEPPRRFKVGMPDQFPDGPTFLAEHHLFVVRNGREFSVISAVCTHLGCTVKLAQLTKPKEVIVRGEPLVESFEFACPCHGSKFRGDGTNYEGPAPKPLAWHRVSVAPDDRQLVVDLSESVPSGTTVRV